MKPAAGSDVALRVTLLGTGTSHGVPASGCDCAVCHSTDPRDRRTRTSILIQLSDTPPKSAFAGAVRNILVDTSTDLRTQALAYDVRRVDAILFTHSHADHVLGLDDVRRYNALQRGAIPCYGDAPTLANIRRMFDYIFNPPAVLAGGLPQISPFRIAGAFTLGGATIVPVPIMHGPGTILAAPIVRALTDRSRIDESWPFSTACTLVLDALRSASPTHLMERLEVVRVWRRSALISPTSRTIFRTRRRAAPGVELAYDGPC